MATTGELRAVLTTIATVLEAKRDRFGRLEFLHPDSALAAQAREVMRAFAMKYDVGGCADTLEQCAKVARAVLHHDQQRSAADFLHAMRGLAAPRVARALRVMTGTNWNGCNKTMMAGAWEKRTCGMARVELDALTRRLSERY